MSDHSVSNEIEQPVTIQLPSGRILIYESHSFILFPMIRFNNLNEITVDMETSMWLLSPANLYDICKFALNYGNNEALFNKLQWEIAFLLNQ